MKKFISVYVTLFVVVLLLILTKGIDWKMELISAITAKSIRDGLNFFSYLLIGNLLIVLVCWTAVIAVTCLRSNKIRFKWLIALALVISLAFVPVIQVKIGGGLMGIHEDRYYSPVQTVGAIQMLHTIKDSQKYDY